MSKNPSSDFGGMRENPKKIASWERKPPKADGSFCVMPNLVTDKKNLLLIHQQLSRANVTARRQVNFFSLFLLNHLFPASRVFWDAKMISKFKLDLPNNFTRNETEGKEAVSVGRRVVHFQFLFLRSSPKWDSKKSLDAGAARHLPSPTASSWHWHSISLQFEPTLLPLPKRRAQSPDWATPN